MSHTCEHDHDHRHDLAPSALQSRLAEAQALAEAQGERMTAPRLRTLELILSAGAPVKAYDLIDKFHQDGAAKPPTVYRALNFLEHMGLIHRIESLNAFVACHFHDQAHLNHPHRAAFLLCDCCGKSQEVVLHDFHEIDQSAAQSGFKTASITLEAKGLCKACAED